ncbi:sigma-70 family RNA polymerase sigma factor [Pseudokordiimonas caeni]|uniref:sigma-70 family RNA polymerase sigma factor n=1 Tax=Pseudokordiimonas caeni TaxID=2997908 RepID=UPI002811BDCC|nr:sigma-70 family RNA polymerase sigma factor [Pseudokordiimonas caeni]
MGQRPAFADASDDRLIAEVAAGSPAAYAVLVDRWAVKCRALAFRMTRDMALAEDMVQDVFVKVWTRAGQFDAGKAKFGTWLYRMVVNRCLDEARRRKPDALPEDYDAPDDAMNAEDLMADASERQRIRDAVATLPERQQTAVVLTYFEELTNQEAADVMEIHVKAFESLLVRARKSLKALMEEWSQGGQERTA